MLLEGQPPKAPAQDRSIRPYEVELFAQRHLDARRAAEAESVASVDEAAIFAVRWPDPARSCGSRADAEFDFWLGEWDYVVGGRVVGFNQISRDPD